MQGLQYFESLPSAEFQDVVQNYWMFKYEGDATDKKSFSLKTLPQTSVSIVYISQPFYNGIRMLGPQRKSYEQIISPGSIFFGIRLNPWIRSIDSNVNSVSIVDKTVELPTELTTLFSVFKLSRSDALDAKKIESTVGHALNESHFYVDELAKFVCLCLLQGLKVNDLLQEVHISLRPLQRHFKKITGLTMTEVRNIARLERTIKQIYFQNQSIFNASLINGYADHAHFIHSFKKYTKSSVKKFLLMTDLIKVEIK